MASLSVSPTTFQINIGMTQQLTATPAGGVKWSCTNCHLILLTSQGLVTALANGTGTITARRGNATVEIPFIIGTGFEPPVDPPPPPIEPPPDPGPEPPPDPPPPPPPDPPPPCAYTATPTSVEMPAAGGSSIVTVTTAVDCAWTAASAVAWITFVGLPQGTGSGTLAYIVDANATTTARTGTLTVAGVTISILQAGTVQVPPPPPPPPPPLPTGTDILPSELVFRGFIRYTFSPWTMTGAAGVGLAFRTVNGVAKVFTLAIDGSPTTQKLLEFDLPTDPPTLDITTAPRCTNMVDHGNIMATMFNEAGITGASNFGENLFAGMLYSEADSGLYFTYGSPYGVASTLYPTLGFVAFDGLTLQQVYGPWRQQGLPNMTRGSLIAIPPSFGDRYLNGARMGITAGSNSGIATCPRGSNLTAILPFNPRTLPAATFPHPSPVYDPANAQVFNKTVIMHDANHRMTRSSNYKMCFWSVEPAPQNYNCVLNNAIFPGPPAFGGPLHLFDNENDSTTSSIWIETPGKQGWIVFGQLVDTPSGYAPGGNDPDGLVHCGYGDPNHATNNNTTGAGYQDQRCCHGQFDPFWFGTGPFANLRVPYGWIYSPSALVAPATGASNLWEATPSATISFTENGGLAFPTIATQQKQGWFAAGAITRQIDGRTYIYVQMRGIDPTSAYGEGLNGTARQPAIGVFEVLNA